MTVEKSKPEDQAESPVENTVATENPADIEIGATNENAEPTLEETLEKEEQALNYHASRIEALEAQLAEAKDHKLRAHAEAMNVKRRAEQDVEKAHKFALEKFVNELIPVVESLEKGIENAEQDEGQHAVMLEGMRLTHKQLLDALAKFEVLQVNPEGEPFDPNFHQAISMVPNPDLEPNTVMNVFQKGYTLHGRVIRPAMVVVSKAP